MDPFEAPQGPTCIYRDREGAAFVTLAIQKQRFASMRRRGRPAPRRVRRRSPCLLRGPRSAGALPPVGARPRPHGDRTVQDREGLRPPCRATTRRLTLVSRPIAVHVLMRSAERTLPLRPARPSGGRGTDRCRPRRHGVRPDRFRLRCPARKRIDGRAVLRHPQPPAGQRRPRLPARVRRLAVANRPPHAPGCPESRSTS